jgi:transcriptional regulator
MPKKLMFENTRSKGALIPGTLDMLILKALSRGRAHGYAVADWIHRTSEDALGVEEGALYPALHRLQIAGLLDAEWGHSDSGRRVKIYRLTRQGRRHLTAETERWQELTTGMIRVLESGS